MKTLHPQIGTRDKTSSFVATADMDGDGDLDVLSSSTNDGIIWYENDGAENFMAYQIITNTDTPLSVATADLDGDGNLDVLTASHFDNTIAWHKQSPFGPLVDAAIYDAASGILTVTRTDAGSGLVRLSGSNNDIDASKLVLTGHGNASHTLPIRPMWTSRMRTALA